jgi:hypothetical protein
MAGESTDLLRHAILRRAGVVLSLPEPGPGGAVQHHRSRLLAQEPNGLWVQAPAVGAGVLDALVYDRATIGVSFRGAGVHKVVFKAQVLGREPQYRPPPPPSIVPRPSGAGPQPADDRPTGPALRLGKPAEFQAIQRRKHFRAPVGPDGDLQARVWRIPPAAPLHLEPPGNLELAARVVDVSVGGVGAFLLPRDAHQPPVAAGDRLRIELALNAVTVLVEGRVCHVVASPSDPQARRAGVQFIMDDLASRQVLMALNRIVGELQRAEVRRQRLAAGAP